MAAFPWQNLRARLLIACLLLSGCASGGSRYLANQQDYSSQAYYRTSMPPWDVSVDLEQTLSGVLRVQVQGFYDTYVFEEEAAPTLDELRGVDSDVFSRSSDEDTSTLTRAATAVLVASVGGRGTLVTTEHGITLPDTTIAFFGSEDLSQSGTPKIQTVSIKRDQTNSVIAPDFVEPFEVLGTNPESDLAAIGVEFPAGENLSGAALPGGARTLLARRNEIPAIRLNSGEPQRLSWGSMVYILGHPAGQQMITRGIVSRPDLGSPDQFLTDGLLNEGSSGAPILAIRGDSEALEWVGIARAAASRTEYRLEPRAEPDQAPQPQRLYDGPIYLSQSDVIRYGITFSIPITEVRAFFLALRPWLEAMGYPIPEL